MGVFLALFPLLARDSMLSSLNKLTLYKLLTRPILTYAAPVWSNTSTTNYRHIQTLQSKCLRDIGNYPRHTPIPLLHSTLNTEPIHEFIVRKIFLPLFYTSKPPRPPNRRLLHVRHPTTVQKIYTQTYETSSIVTPPSGRSVFCILSTSFHCHNIASVLFTDEQL
jgi:hypothetical protein